MPGSGDGRGVSDRLLLQAQQHRIDSGTGTHDLELLQPPCDRVGAAVLDLAAQVVQGLCLTPPGRLQSQYALHGPTPAARGPLLEGEQLRFLASNRLPHGYVCILSLIHI